MATATPTPTPNPDAMKFTLDVKLAEMMNVISPAEAVTPFAKAVFAAPGVANLFGVNDFVTVTREPGADWDPIVAAVQSRRRGAAVNNDPGAEIAAPLRTRVTELLGVRYPIVQAPMGWIARAQLASAVSNAGGLGIIETSSGELDAVRERDRARCATSPTSPSASTSPSSSCATRPSSTSSSTRA